MRSQYRGIPPDGGLTFYYALIIITDVNWNSCQRAGGPEGRCCQLNSVNGFGPE